MAAYSETVLCNMALAKIGAKRINSFDNDTSVEAIQCKTHYSQVRDSLLRSYVWHFASGRAELSEDTVKPSFRFAHQYILPSDFLRLVEVYRHNDYMLEGHRILTNHDTCKIEYIRRVTDCSEFNPGFVSALTLALAIELTSALAGVGAGASLRDRLSSDLARTLYRVRLVDASEDDTSSHHVTWLQSRHMNIGGR